MEEQIVIQENTQSPAEQSPKSKKKQKFKELSKFWKITVICLTVTTLVALGAAIGYFMVNVYPLFGLMGV